MDSLEKQGELKVRFVQLKKNLKKDFSGLKIIKVALLGDSATQHLTQAIRGYGYEAGFDLDIFEADYDQIDRQVLSRNSALYQSQPEYVILFQAAQKLKRKFYGAELTSRSNFAQEEAARFGGLLDEISKNIHGVKIILANFMELNDRGGSGWLDSVSHSLSGA